MFKITIEQTRVETVHLNKQWLPKADGSVGYEYSPETDTEATMTRTVYEQTVDDLNLKAVIATVNELQIANEVG